MFQQLKFEENEWKTQSLLLLKDWMGLVKLGKYLHFKGAEVEVLLEGKHSETLEEMVVYKHLDTSEVWVRPKKMFLEKVEVNGKKIPRFKFIGK